MNQHHLSVPGTPVPALSLSRSGSSARAFAMAILVVAALLVLPGISAAATRIGSEASVPLLSSALWRGYIGNAPADGTVQELNPPIFRWTYLENPLDSERNTLRTFRFQIGYGSDLAQPVVDVVCSNNFYNFLAPFTNADGSAYELPIYWRVTYMNSNATANVATGAVRRFTLARNATAWDRSMLGDPGYLRRVTKHPFLLVRETNRAEILRWCQTSQWATAWTSISNRAFRTIAQSWWNQPEATNVYEWPLHIAEIALVYQLTGSPILLAADPMSAASTYAKHYLARNYDRLDPVASGVQIEPRYLAYMYDWLYDKMNTDQRSNVLYALESVCRFSLYKFWWYNNSAADFDRTYPGPYGMDRTSASRLGGSHQRVAETVAFPCMLAGLGDSAFLRDYFQYSMNYHLAQHDPYWGDGGAVNQGRGYIAETLWDTRAAGAGILAAMAFPEARLQLNPFFKGLASFMMHWCPVRFSHVLDPWGDLGGWRPIDWQSLYMRDLALVTGDPVFYQQHVNAFAARDRYVSDPGIVNLLTPFYFPPPGQTNAGETSFVSVDDGWAISASKPPNTRDAFTNGVGFVFHARPRGSEVNHSSLTDGHIECWAYGALLSECGVGNYRKHPMYYNVCLVDGIGTCLPQTPTLDWYSRLTGWRNDSQLTYVAADLTRAYNRSNFSIGGYGLNSEFVKYYSAHRVPYLTNALRHVLFPRKRYWVLYDRLQTTQPATFSWIWHILEPTALVDADNCSFSYTATNHYHRSNVTVHVKHIVNPSLMKLISMAGTNLARANPITGEDYHLSDGDLYPRQHFVEWVSNRTPTTNWHFLSVIYPQRWDESPPTIERIDDYTVAVTSGTGRDRDVVTFDTNRADLATVVVDVGAVASPAQRPQAPEHPRVVEPLR